MPNSPRLPDYSHYFWQGQSTRLRPWRLEDAELRYMASLDSRTLAFHQAGITLPTSVELQRAWLEKAAGLQDDGMLRFAMDNLDGFVITGGKGSGTSVPDGTGGGLYCEGLSAGFCSPTIANVIFSGNQSGFGGPPPPMVGRCTMAQSPSGTPGCSCRASCGKSRQTQAFLVE